MNRRSNGFTLIEILVVVSILAVLMGLVTILIFKGQKSKGEFLTDTTIQQLQTAIEGYKRDIENRYPPMNVGELGRIKRYKGVVTDANQTNESSEVLLVALRHPDLRSPIGDDLPLDNTDNDNWTQKPDGMPDVLAKEVVDAWGSPIVYFHKDGYDKPQQVVNYKGETVDVFAVKKPDGSFYNPVGFQLISLGPDGVPDTDYSEPDLAKNRFNFKLEKGQ